MFATTLVPAHYLKKTKELLLLEREEDKSFVCLFVVCLIFIYIYIFSCLSLIGCYINDDWGTETYPTTCGLVRK